MATMRDDVMGLAEWRAQQPRRASYFLRCPEISTLHVDKQGNKLSVASRVEFGKVLNDFDGLRTRTMTDNSNIDSDPEHDADSLLPHADPPPLPQLTEKAAVYSGCCLALSTPLVAHLLSLLPLPPTLTLSIGSGFGLLEALLNGMPYASNIVGVEVEPSPNKYLSNTRHRTVYGTRFLEPLAAEAQAWLFVYPKRVALVSEYIAAFGRGNVRTIVWAGPQADWHDYKGYFTGWNVETTNADEVGGKAWELIATAKKVPE